MRIENNDATNDLLVYINGNTPITILQGGASFEFEGLVYRLAVSAGFTSQAAELPVRVATAAALPAYTQSGTGAGATLTDDGVGVLTVDGVDVVLSDRILVKDGAAGSDNGIYTVTTEGTGIPATTAETIVRVITDAALPAYTQAGAGAGATLTADAVGILTVDGVATVLNDRILVKDGAAGSDNGIYTVTTEGTGGVAFVLTRAADHDTDAEVTSGDFVSASVGTANAGLWFQISTLDPIVVDTTAVTWTEVFKTVLTRAADHDTDAEVTESDYVVVTEGATNSNTSFQITTTDPITVDTTAVVWSQMGAEFEVLVILAA
jgi:hypothetical protein